MTQRKNFDTRIVSRKTAENNLYDPLKTPAPSLRTNNLSSIPPSVTTVYLPPLPEY